MVEKVIRVGLRTGLHARPAAKFVQLSRSFESDIWVARQAGGRSVDAKDIIAVLSLDILEGEKVIIGAEGRDEGKAVDALAKEIE